MAVMLNEILWLIQASPKRSRFETWSIHMNSLIFNRCIFHEHHNLYTGCGRETGDYRNSNN